MKELSFEFLNEINFATQSSKQLCNAEPELFNNLANAANELIKVIYPQSGIMVIPTLEDSRVLEHNQGNAFPPGA